MSELWIDTRTGLVVDTQPEEGRVLVADGEEVPPHLMAIVGVTPAETAEPDGDETAAEPAAEIEVLVDEPPAEPTEPAAEAKPKRTRRS